ncbi:hypothetical protein [Arcobacter sp.]|uniref:hypothetical protein n=1 Tax=unclassified Arcobacter TaxID=2593671 RepID=UPI003B00D59F
MKEIRKFTFEDEEYEIRITSDGWTYTIRVYKNNELASGNIYTVDTSTIISIKMSKIPMDPLEDMIKTAQNDIIEKRWEKYVKAMKRIADKQEI